MDASSYIRDAIGRMPERRRSVWHIEDDNLVFAEQANAWVAEGISDPEACYISIMDPMVGLALADLIDASHALEAFDEEEHNEPYIAWANLKAEWRASLRALETAIKNEGSRGVEGSAKVEP